MAMGVARTLIYLGQEKNTWVQVTRPNLNF